MANADPTLTKFQHQLLIGTVMGDASLQKGSANAHARLMMGHGVRQRDYLQHKFEVLRCMYGPARKLKFYPSKRGAGYFVASKAYPFLTGLQSTFYVEDLREGKRFRKIIDRDVLGLLDDVALAYWFMDDGSLYVHSGTRNSLMMVLGNLTDAEYLLVQEWFMDGCGLEGELKDNGSKCKNLVFDVGVSEYLAEMIRTYVIPSMNYKLKNIGMMGPSKKRVELSESGYYGVSKAGDRWQAAMMLNGHLKYLGRFDSALEAAVHRNSDILESGSNSRLNRM